MSTSAELDAMRDAALDHHQRASCPEAQWCEHCPCECGEPWPCRTRRALDPDYQEATR